MAVALWQWQGLLVTSVSLYSLAAAGVSRVGTVGEVALVRCADRVVVSWGRPGVWLRFWGYGWG